MTVPATDAPDDGDQTGEVSPPADTDDTPDAGTAAAAGEDSPAEDTQTDTGDDTPDDGDAPAAGRSPALQKLLDKYGGDEDAMVAAYFEQANSSSRLTREVSELRDFLMNQETEEDPEKLIAEDPDVQGLNTQLTSLQSDIEAIQQDQMQLVGSYGQVENEIKTLKAAADKAEDFEKVTLQQQVSTKTSELRAIMSGVNRGRRELNAVNREIAGIERQQDKAKQSVLGRRETQRKEELRGAQVARLTREEFNTAMRTHAKDYGISAESKQFNVLSTSVRNQLSQHLNRLPKDAPGVDINAAVKHLMGEFAEAMNLKSTFKKVSDSKRTPVTSGPRSAGPPLPKGVNEPKVPKSVQQFDKSGNWTLEYTRWRADQMLPG
jgi:hypothetical protein